MIFQASYDTMAKAVSGLVCAVVAIAAVATGSLLVGGFGVVFVLMSLAWSTKGYAIVEGQIVIRRWIGDVRIPLESVREARAAGGGDLAGCIRLFGNGGLFGYYGLFQTTKLGRCNWYVTNRDRAVVLITDVKTLVVSPDDVEGFLGAIPRSAPDASWQAPTGSSNVGMWFGIGVAALVLAVVAFAFLYSPGPPRYTLTPQALTIHDRFYAVTLQAGAVDVEHIRVVDIAADPVWRPTARTNGFANSYYRSGQFRVAGGQIVRLYQASSARLVLLPPRGSGMPVLLETTDPQKLIADVRQAWGRALP